MLGSNSRSLWNHVVNPVQEKERLRYRYGKDLQKMKVLNLE